MEDWLSYNDVYDMPVLSLGLYLVRLLFDPRNDISKSG